MQSVLNVRMDSALKERGDKVLAENGISVSNAVRSLWEELAKSREVPSFIVDSSDGADRRKRRRAAFEKLCSIRESGKSKVDLSSLDKKAFRDMQYEKKWEKYEALQ